jgi:hypothetical protein
MLGAIRTAEPTETPAPPYYPVFEATATPTATPQP